MLFQEEGLKKVYDIFTSGSLESGVRKSASEQLAIILSGMLGKKNNFMFLRHRLHDIQHPHQKF